MGYTFSVTCVGLTNAFLQVAPGPGLFALACSVGPPIRDIFRFHAPGTSGNVTVRDKPRGRVILIRGLASDDLSTAWGGVQAMFTAWSADVCSITDPGGIVYTACNLTEAKVLDVRADGTDTNGHVEITFEAVFTKDQDY